MLHDYFSCLFTDCESGLVSVKDTELDNDEFVEASLMPCASVEGEDGWNTSSDGGLSTWKYFSPFAPMTLSIDKVDADLYPILFRKANIILDNVLEHFSPQAETRREEQHISRLEVFEAFLPLSTLEKLRVHIIKVLLARMKPPCSTSELQSVIILHILAASYDASVSIINTPKNKAFSFRCEFPDASTRKWRVLYLVQRGKERDLNKENARVE